MIQIEYMCYSSRVTPSLTRFDSFQKSNGVRHGLGWGGEYPFFAEDVGGLLVEATRSMPELRVVVQAEQRLRVRVHH